MIALVLAAGRGARMGGPKALLAWGEAGDSLPAAHAAAARAQGCERVIVVVRAAVADALGSLAGAEWVRSGEDEDLGPSGSIKAAVRALPELTRAGLVAVNNVDCAPQSWEALGALRGALADSVDAAAAQPRHGERGGHPVLLRGEALAAYLPSGDNPRDVVPTLRDLLAALGPQVLRIPVGVGAVLADMDTPGEYARWRPAR